MGERMISKEEDLNIQRFYNPSAASTVAEHRVRHVVTCVHIPSSKVGYEPVLPVGLQLPINAAKNGGINFSSLQGGVESNESTINALTREACEEYHLVPGDIHFQRYLLSTKVPVDPRSSKFQYWDYQWLHWFLLCTKRHFKPNSEHVAQFSWFSGPDSLFDAMATAREEKLCAMAAAIAAAIRQGAIPTDYKVFAGLLRHSKGADVAA